ncbi:hypothetical protein LXA43DRAFT_993261 [Ganoderma leucocontextum]|nr:hypothetical protein LXA43DRAFT_993261 [Ganoderma leucocontextum]
MSVPDSTNNSNGQQAAPAALIYPLDDFEDDISNLFSQAFTCRGSEHHLYPLYNHILTLTCFDLRHPNNARVSLSCSPQALFGEIPLPGTGNEESSDPSNGVGKRRKSVKKKDQKKKTEEAEEDDSRYLPPKQFPDFARLVVFSNREERFGRSGPAIACGIADFFELKSLSGPERWGTDEAEAAALNHISQHLTQVYDSAMAGFAYNPSWKQLYAFLIIGPYFTQLHWKKRPKDDVLKPIVKTEVPASIKEGVDYRGLIGKVLNQIPLYEARRRQNALPDVLYYNEPVFSYQPGDEDSSYQRISLSSAFVFSLSSPIKTGFPQLSRRSSIFEPPTSKPKLIWGTKSSVDSILEKVLITTPIENLKKQARSLGHRFPGDPAPSPTPPNSTAEQRFKASVKGIKKLPKPHVKTRLQKANLVVPEEDDDGDDGAAGDAEAE